MYKSNSIECRFPVNTDVIRYMFIFLFIVLLKCEYNAVGPVHNKYEF